MRCEYGYCSYFYCRLGNNVICSKFFFRIPEILHDLLVNFLELFAREGGHVIHAANVVTPVISYLVRSIIRLEFSAAHVKFHVLAVNFSATF